MNNEDKTICNNCDTHLQIEKICNTCGLSKHVNEFGKNKPQCKECRNIKERERLNNPVLREKERKRGKERYKKTSQKHLAITKKYHEENLPHYKELHLRSKYGLTMDDKIKMREVQQNKCAICEKEFETDRHAYVDHCHKTNNVRGLLCRKCNSGLGMFEDNIEFMERAISYIGNHSVQQVTIPTTPNQ